jgi:DHA3 family macrolide efflux protein-like MFS transporter
MGRGSNWTPSGSASANKRDNLNTQPRLAQGMRTFTTIWFGQLISTLGSGLSGFALGVWLYEETGSTTLFALSMFVWFLPSIFFAPVAGVLTDRYDRRLLMILADSMACLATIFIGIMVFTDNLQFWQIYVADIFYSIANTLQWPAYSAATSLMVPKKHLGRAGGMTQIGDAVSSLAAPAVAGAMYVTMGLKPILLIDILTFVLALITLIAVRFPQPEKTEESQEGRGSFWREAVYGWHYIRQRPGLFHLLLVFAALNFCISITIPLLTPMILEMSTPDILGYVSSIISIGMLVGTLLMSTWGGFKRRIYGSYLGESLIGISMIFTGLFSSIPLITAAQLLGMLAMPITNGSSQAIWQTKVAQDVQGRVFSVRRMLAFSIIPLAYLATGPISERVFTPLLLEGGPLADSVGRIFGSGPGRGIGLMFTLFGLLYFIIAQLIYFDKNIRNVELDLPDAVPTEAEIVTE